MNPKPTKETKVEKNSAIRNAAKKGRGRLAKNKQDAQQSG
jgi:hypothetical protein